MWTWQLKRTLCVRQGGFHSGFRNHVCTSLRDRVAGLCQRISAAGYKVLPQWEHAVPWRLQNNLFTCSEECYEGHCRFRSNCIQYVLIILIHRTSKPLSVSRAMLTFSQGKLSVMLSPPRAVCLRLSDASRFYSICSGRHLWNDTTGAQLGHLSLSSPPVHLCAESRPVFKRKDYSVLFY